MGVEYTRPPQSRNEAILDSIVEGIQYTDPPQSRIEDLLLQVKEVIEEGGHDESATRASIAPTESDSAHASTRYEVGEQFYMSDDKLYEVTSPIAVNAAIIVYPEANYNVKLSDSVTGQIGAIKDSLGTASTKDSTSVVTDSTDLVESKAVKNIVGWGNKNLLDPSILSGSSLIYVPLTVGDGEFTMSSNVPLNWGNAANLFLLEGNVSDGASTANNGVYTGQTRTVTAVNGYVTVASRVEGDVDPRLYNNQLEKGSTATSYEPYHASVEEEINRIDAQLEALSTHRIYGFHIKANESDPDNMVTYLADAVDATPAYMDYARNVFDYGTWEHAFFMPKPCMLKSDGTVAYYLKEDDYTKKADGTASDIANTAFDGNAMMEWGQGSKIWLKIVPDEHGEGASVFIANYQADEDFHDYSFHNSAGVSVDHFYTPIYNGSVISSKMRSLSGQQVSKSLTGEQEITAAKLNNPGSDEMWNTECFADRILINMLLILMSKTVDTQTAFGQGLNASGSETINDAFRTGVHNDKGLFYGTNSGAAATYANAVKVFGMENWFGFQWRRIRGLILSDGAFKVKLTYGQEDGSTVTGYNTDGAGYINQNLATPSDTSGSYIVSHSFTKDGMFPKTLNGTQTTYYCDSFWYNNSGARFALCGGDSSNGAKVGAFCLSLDYAVSSAAWSLGAALSCKPLAQG